jgi:hypothetical protein
MDITNRWSCRLKWSSVSYGCRCCGSLRAGGSAAQLNSMLSGRQSCHGEPFGESNSWILGQEKENDVGLTDLVRYCKEVFLHPSPPSA